MNKEVTALESDPVIQRLRQQKLLRQQQQSRHDKENRARVSTADVKVLFMTMNETDLVLL